MQHKTAFIATIFNEQNTISQLLESLVVQTISPDEVVIVDGGSTDNTVKIVRNWINKHSDIKIILIQKKGNRSVGRNEAIRNASADIILVSDAGCILDKRWVENVISPFNDKSIDIVSGYYELNAETVFEKSLAPYVLVPADKVDPNHFLPASRSCAFRKQTWKLLGGYPEEYSHNEDYVFAKKMEKKGLNIFFQKNAIVYWKPRSNIRDAFIMFYRFAFGDAEAGIFRPKVGFIFLRYILILVLSMYYMYTENLFIGSVLLILFIVYILWAIIKNYKYVKRIQAVYYLPLFQVISDAAIISGTALGITSNKK